MLDEVQPQDRGEGGPLHGFLFAHPHQPDHTVQGSLELLWRLERALCEITGMTRATLQPPAGACGELTGLLIMRAHHERQGRQRRRVAIPDSSHGTNPASVRLAGYEALNIPSDVRGLIDVSALEKLIDEDVAGLMLTNPNTLGMFEEEIERVTEAVHRIGGLVYYDGANLNAILGRCRPGDMGFDIVHINTHKTFATPHGGGGPGAGPVGVTEALVPYLPIQGRTRRERRLPARHRSPGIDRSDARVPRQLRGARPRVCVRVPPRPDGLKEVAERAVLNANYLAERVKGAFPLAYPDGRPMHEFVATARPLKEETGIRAMDVAKRVIDLGYHPSTVYFPLVVEEALMVEPTETETKESLDAFADALLQAYRDAHDDPELLHEAPVTTPVRRLDEARAARHLKLRW